MSSKSTYHADATLNHFRGTAYPSVPTNYYVSLHDGDPGTTGANELAASDAYARVAMAPDPATWDAPATSGDYREIANTGAVAFPEAEGDWGTVTHFGIWDAATSGNFIRGGELAAPRVVSTGVTATFAAGELKLRELITEPE